MMGQHLHQAFLDLAKRRAATLYQGTAGGRVWRQTVNGWTSRLPEPEDVRAAREAYLQPLRWRC